jgi:hypothetical protein
MSKQYPRNQRERAARMVLDRLGLHENEAVTEGFPPSAPADYTTWLKWKS